MRKSAGVLTVLFPALTALVLVQPARAGMEGMGGGGGMGAGMGEAGISAEQGLMIHQGMAGDYRFRFHNMPMKMEGTTNHLMVYILGQDDKAVLGAKVSYEITGPDQREQKVECIPMATGYAGNVDFSARGRYSIQVKAVSNESILSYSFDYEVK